MTGILRAGVAGAGVFGGFHAAKYAALPGVRLAAVFDRDAERAARLAERHAAQPFDDLDAFFAEVDVVSIAAAAVAHGLLGLAALRAGKAAYVEKPLAADLASAQALCREAEARGLTLACGHQERLTLQALGLLAPQAPRPRRIEAVRHGPWSGRGADVSAFLDLMIHDADFALALTGAEPADIRAESLRVYGALADAGRAEIRFGNGAEATLSASRVAPERARSLCLIYEAGPVRIDFLANRIEDGAGLGLPERLPLADPLGEALARFVAAARGEGAPAVNGEEGLAALALALAVESAC